MFSCSRRFFSRRRRKGLCAVNSPHWERNYSDSVTLFALVLPTKIYLLAQTFYLPFFFLTANVCTKFQSCLSRLRELLEAEEQQYLQEIEAKKETSLQRQEKMKQYIKALRERREKERQQLVSDKLEQLFR